MSFYWSPAGLSSCCNRHLAARPRLQGKFTDPDHQLGFKRGGGDDTLAASWLDALRICSAGSRRYCQDVITSESRRSSLPNESLSHRNRTTSVSTQHLGKTTLAPEQLPFLPERTLIRVILKNTIPRIKEAILNVPRSFLPSTSSHLDDIFHCFAHEKDKRVRSEFCLPLHLWTLWTWWWEADWRVSSAFWRMNSLDARREKETEKPRT